MTLRLENGSARTERDTRRGFVPRGSVWICPHQKVPADEASVAVGDPGSRFCALVFSGHGERAGIRVRRHHASRSAA